MQPDQLPEEFVIESDGTVIGLSVLNFAAIGLSVLKQRRMHDTLVYYQTLLQFVFNCVRVGDAARSAS